MHKTQQIARCKTSTTLSWQGEGLAVACSRLVWSALQISTQTTHSRAKICSFLAA